MADLTPLVARRIIDIVGANGIPPQYGFQYFTAGLDAYLDVIDSEYLGTFIKQGGAAFKMVVGVYGGGKTHFLYCVRDIAWKYSFVASYVSLGSGESPFHRLELVFGALARGIIPPVSPEQLLSGYEQGIESFLKAWYGQKYQTYVERGFAQEEIREALQADIDQIDNIESSSFGNAIKTSLRALANKRDDDFTVVGQWLKGEGYDRKIHPSFGILERIDRTTAPKMIRSLVQCIQLMGYSGIVLLLDEAEQTASLSKKQVEQHLSNLRELIDQCSNTNFQHVMIFYAVPDENFLQKPGNVYEALRQRVSTVLEEFNPAGVKIELERVVPDAISFLKDIGARLSVVYQVAYGQTLPATKLDETISLAAETALADRYLDIGYKRLFVKRLIAGLNHLRLADSVLDADKLSQIT